MQRKNQMIFSQIEASIHSLKGFRFLEEGEAGFTGSGLWHGMDELWTVIWMHVLMDSFEADQNWASMQHSNGTYTEKQKHESNQNNTKNKPAIIKIK